MKVLGFSSIALIMAIAPLAAQPVLDHEATIDIQISDEDLIEQWYAADEDCRGYNPGNIEMWVGCSARDVYQQILEHRGYCLPGPTVSATWQRCE